MLTLMTRSGRGFYDWKNDKLQTYRSRLSNRLKNHGYTLGEKRDIDRQRRDEDHPYYSTQIRAVVAECLLCSPSERPSAERLLEKTQEGLNAMLRAKGIDPIVAGLKYPPYHQALLDDKFYVSDIQYINAQAGAAGGTAQVQQAEQERLAREQDARKQAAPEAAAQAARERAAREARDRAAAEARVRAEQADRERQRERERTIREQAERDQERGRVPVDRGAGRAPRHGGRARKQAGQERADRELAQQLADFGIDSVEGRKFLTPIWCNLDGSQLTAMNREPAITTSSQASCSCPPSSEGTSNNNIHGIKA